MPVANSLQQPSVPIRNGNYSEYATSQSV